jgi:DNA repair protein RadA/Sms
VKPPKVVFVCQECGAQSPKWMGKCVECGAWNSFVEERPAFADESGSASAGKAANRYAQFSTSTAAKLYAEVETTNAERLSSGIGEFDRVLGGGVVPGSLVLLGGEPGIGKSTLLLQAAAHFAANVGPVLYASGEESEHQIKSRGDRLGVGAAPLYLLSETCIERILEEIARLKPALVVIDSYRRSFPSSSNRRPAALDRCAKPPRSFCLRRKDRTFRPSSSVTSPKMATSRDRRRWSMSVDTVLYFEGERHHSHRVIRAIKNRFGAVSELGVFEMTGSGLRPVANPSRLFLSERASGTPGSAVLCCVEGSRPILVEVQALVSTSTYGNARRMAIGIDQNRLSLLLAVLEKRAGLSLAGDDVYVNIAGGMNIEEPAAD